MFSCLTFPTVRENVYVFPPFYKCLYRINKLWCIPGETLLPWASVCKARTETAEGSREPFGFVERADRTWALGNTPVCFCLFFCTIFSWTNHSLYMEKIQKQDSSCLYLPGGCLHCLMLCGCFSLFFFMSARFCLTVWRRGAKRGLHVLWLSRCHRVLVIHFELTWRYSGSF